MTTLFLACAGLGASVLVIQILLSLVGMDHGYDAFDGSVHAGDAELGEGFSLFSVRTLSAGVAFYGISGIAGVGLGIPAPVAAMLALLPAFGAMIGTAYVMRQMLSLESTGSIDIEGAIGSAATVYLLIPESGRGPGKVQVAVQGRTMELQAITSSRAPIPTGSSVVVVSVIDADTVEVVPTSLVEEVLDDNR